MLKKSFKKIIATSLIAVAALSWGSIASAQSGGFGGVIGWIQQHPMIVAASIATAVAVPLAVADDDAPASR